jgi:thioester reductase-like protein
LIRANDAAHAAERLRQRFARSGREVSENITPVCGDISKPFCGLAESDLRGVQRECDTIVHAAGETSFKNAKECSETNVHGAREVIQLAGTWRNPLRVFYMSTASVCCSPAHADLSEDTAPAGYANGYTLSKRQAERLMIESGLDAVILRPTIVLSRGIQDRHFARSILWIVPAVIQLADVPIDGNGRLDVAPVDYVATAVERLVSKNALRHRCYHLSAGPMASVTCVEIRGASRRVYPDAAKVRFFGPVMKRAAEGKNGAWRALQRAVAYYAPFANADITYRNDRLAEELGEEMPVCPKATEYLAELVSQFGVDEALAESLRP